MALWDDRGIDHGVRGLGVGDHVLRLHTVFGRAEKADLLRVTSAGKTSFTLEDATKWTWRGEKWGRGRDPCSRGPALYKVVDLEKAKAYVAAVTAERRLDDARYRVREFIDRGYKLLSMEDCVAIWKITAKYRNAGPGGGGSAAPAD